MGSCIRQLQFTFCLAWGSISAGQLLCRWPAAEDQLDDVLQVHDVEPLPFDCQQGGSRLVEENGVVMQDRDFPARGED